MTYSVLFAVAGVTVLRHVIAPDALRAAVLVELPAPGARIVSILPVAS